MSETTADRLLSLQIQHAIHLLRYGNGVEKDILKLLESANTDVLERLAKRLALVDARGFDSGPATTARLNKMLEEVRTVSEGAYQKSYSALSTELIAFAATEAAFQAASIEKALPVADLKTTIPAPSRLKAIATERPIMGSLLKDHFSGMAEGHVKRIEQSIKIGMFEGQGVEQIVRRVRDVDMEISRRSARSIVRTGINHVANQAAQETWKANERVVKGWRFVATLDSRTTIICGSLDGQVFPIGEGPVPPRHRGCRSITIAQTKTFDEMGLDREEYSNETRASIDGPISGKTDFEGWLKGQSEERQNAVLGKTRADLFRKGELNLRDFVRDGREVIPLDQLAKRNAAATKPDKAPTPAPAAPVEAKPFSPINPATTAETIKVSPRKDVTKELNSKLSAASKNSRYDPTPEFRSIKAEQFGKAQFGTGFTDEAASMIRALHPELDTMSEAFGIPKLRAIKSGQGTYIATMGDGVLTLNPSYFTGYASGVGGKRVSVAASVIAERDALAVELKAMSDELGGMRVRLRDLTGSAKEALAIEYLDKAKVFNAKRDVWVKLDKKILVAKRGENAATRQASTWKPGDDVAKRPHNVTDYFADPLDRARSVLYHEFAHHVHQMTGKAGRRSVVGKPPVEKHLRVLFSQKFHALGSGHEAKKRVASTYATTNEHEWFAENFSSYMMGRFDLVEPEIKELIERLLNEVKNASA